MKSSYSRRVTLITKIAMVVTVAVLVLTLVLGYVNPGQMPMG